ncbi:CopG family transcriptional regulator [Candidatus Poriferisodalis sp.]|uniref:CopG family transcriptional regulator n=1 Tax=Candidatus Poriferisodalis sp. TaxID=3101277 RepID=UPI003C6F2F9A
MTVLSIRFRRPGAYDRLRRRADQGAESISAVGERLIDEGLRMEAHPGVCFRDGPSGRRAGLASGPDVWEVVGLLRGLRGSVEERAASSAAQMGLTSAQVRAAGCYYVEFTDEIDSELAHNDEAAEREMAGWERERQLLSG